MKMFGKALSGSSLFSDFHRVSLLFMAPTLP